MAQTSLQVSKVNLENFFSGLQNESILIPEYQRPYAWERDQVEQLFEDLVNFAISNLDDDKKEYFLGTIIYFSNDSGQKEIIDGQQRLTTIILLLKVIYDNLSRSETKTKEAQNFIDKVAPYLYKKDELNGEIYKDQILINSMAISDEGNENFKNLLKNYMPNSQNKDNYTQNFNILDNLYKNFATKISIKEPLAIYKFINTILKNVIILPIAASSMDNALDIFSTLNDRGKPLSDSDVFKAVIYKKLDNQSRKSFITDWKELEKDIENKFSMTYLFNIYMFYIKAVKNNRDTTLKNIRDFFLKDNFEILMDQTLLINLRNIFDILDFAINANEIENDEIAKNIKIKKSFQILRNIPNEWWKYPSIIYYLSHKDEIDFIKNYENFLEKLFAYIFKIYTITHNVNSLKKFIFNLNIEILKEQNPKFSTNFSTQENKNFENSVQCQWWNLAKAQLLFMTYNNFDGSDCQEILDDKIEIEHIFPKKYKDNYLNFEQKRAEELIWHIGNLTLLEKKLNIEANNGYFEKKIEKYKKSKVKMTFDLTNQDDWTIEDIIKRNEKVKDFMLLKLKEKIES